jgi:hypothetical protein
LVSLTVYIPFSTADIVFLFHPTLFQSFIFTPSLSWRARAEHWHVDTQSHLRYACLASYPHCLPPAYFDILLPVLSSASGLPVYRSSGRVHRVRTEGRRTSRFLDHRAEARVGCLTIPAGHGD